MDITMKTAALHNLGCKVNSYEMDAMEQMLVAGGYKIVPFEEKADVYIVNTCTVTNIADRKSRQMLHRAKSLNPESVVVAVGCYVQTGLENVLKDEGIDLCIGNNKKGQIVSILAEYLNLKQPDENADLANTKSPSEESVVTGTAHKTLNNTTITDIGAEKEYEDIQIIRTAERCRAFIKIQDGCNQFCSYCIIPYARGRVRSRKPEAVLHEIECLAEQGYQEFVITGIHISSYGSEWAEADGISRAGRFYDTYLLELLQKISLIDGVKRIRLGSLEPRIITEDFVEKLAAIPKLCPHFHLSLQSGCDETLKRMNRKYTAKEYEQSVTYLRKYFKHPAITTDVITGFPGETEEEFEQSRKFAEKIGFFELHVFKYSKRQNTPAAVMPGQLTDAVKSARSDVLLHLTKKQSEEYRRYYIDKKVEVLFEEQKDIDGEKYWIGHTPQYVRIAVQSEEDLHNRIENVKVTEDLMEDYLLGIVCRN